jgi:hypothetical protein
VRHPVNQHSQEHRKDDHAWDEEGGENERPPNALVQQGI